MHINHEKRCHVGKQCERQPFQIGHVPSVLQQNLQPDANNTEGDHVNGLWAPQDEVARVGHGAEVGIDVEDVCGGQQSYEDLQKPVRVVLAEVSGEAATRRSADASAYHLDRGHQRIGEQHRPGQRISELGSGLAVGGDPAGIVVGRTRNQSRSESVQQPRFTGGDDAAGRRSSRFFLEAILGVPSNK